MHTRKTIKTAWLFAALLAAQVEITFAQTTATWIGPATGGEWNAAANWDIGVPGSDINGTTNAIIGKGTNVNYNLPMVAASFGVLTNNGILNINTNGFNCSSITETNNASRLFVNNGGVVNVSGSIALYSNAVVSMATGSSLTVSGTLMLGPGSVTAVAFGSFTNNGGLLNASAVSLNANNVSIATSSRLLILGGTNNLGTYSAQRSPGGANAAPALGTDGLVISNGLVNTTSISVGNNAHGIIYVAGGTVTNAGTLTLKNATVSRPARFVQTGGLFVDPDPNVVIMQGAADTVYSVLGGTNIVGGFQFNGATIYFTNAGAIYVGSAGISLSGTPAINAYLNNGGLLGATTNWTSLAAMNINSGTFTFKTADLNNNPNGITLSAALGGTGNLNIIGGGTLTLGAANTYSGSTLINGGTLALGAGATVASPKIIVGSGTTFDVSQVSGFTLSGSQTLAGYGTVTGAVAAAVSSTIYPGSNSVAGTLSFTGSLTENGGVNNTFNLSSDPSGPNNDFINCSGGLTLGGTNTITLIGSLASGGVYALINYGGSLTGDVTNFTVTGATGTFSNSPTAHTIYFIAQSSVRGATNITWLGNAAANNWDTEITTNWLNNGTATLDFFVPNDNTLFSNLGAANSVVNIPGNVSPGSITINTSSNYTFTGNGAIGGVGSLTVSNGTLTVLTTNIYTGSTIFAGGVLATPVIANSGSPSGIGAASSDPGNLIFNGGTLSYFGGSVGTDHGMTLTNSGGTIDVTNGTTLTLNGTLSGNGGLTLIDSGTLTLTAGNSYLGNTTVSNGTLNLNNIGGASSGAIILAGGTLDLTVGSQPTYANNLTVTANSTLISAGGNNNILSGLWTGNTNVTLNVTISSGTFSLNGALTNFYGTIELGNDAGFFRFNAGGGNTQFGATNATIDLGSNTVTLEARNPGTMGIGALEGGPNTILAGPSATAGILVWAIGSSTNNPNTTYYGTIKNNAANEVTSVTKIGTGSLTLAGQNSYGGTTTVSSGTLALTNNPFTSNDGSINNSTNITIAAGAAIDVSGLSTGTLPLGSSQFLQGYGTIRGILDNTAGGNISPGGGISGGVGTLTVTNYINLGGTAWMKLNRTASPNSDRLVSSLAGINYGGTLIVTNIGGGLHAGDTFTLFSGAGFTNSFSTVTLPNYYTWNTSQLTVNGTISVSSVAPPTLAVDFSGLGGGSITFNAANGLAGGPLTILASPNVALPLSSWTTVTTGNFDGSGNFSTPVTVNPTVPQQYFILSAQ